MLGGFITEYAINTKLRLKVRSEKLEDPSIKISSKKKTHVINKLD